MAKKKRNPRVMFNKDDFRFYEGGVDNEWNKEIDQMVSEKRTPQNHQEKRLLRFLLNSEDPRHPDWRPRYLHQIVKFWPAWRVFIEDTVDHELTADKVRTELKAFRGKLEKEGYFLPDYVFDFRVSEPPKQISLFEDTGLSFLKEFKRDQ
jgi:hypothetical protein